MIFFPLILNGGTTLKSHHSREGSAAAIIVVIVLGIVALISLCVAVAKQQQPQRRPVATNYQTHGPQQSRMRYNSNAKPSAVNGLGGKTMGEWMDGRGDSEQLKARKKRMGGR